MRGVCRDVSPERCMWFFGRLVWRCGIGLTALSATSAMAGGPISDLSILDDRARTVSELWAGSFTAESARLVDPVLPPKASVDRTAIAYDHDDIPQSFGDERRALMRRLLSTEKYALTLRVESIEAADSAYAEALVLGELLANYLAGVVAFRGSDYALAERYFSTASEFPNTVNAPWSLIARYMHARSLELSGEADLAISTYLQVVDRTRQGEADPLGLGLSSLGMIGRIHARKSAWPEAALAYAQQAASGDEGATFSLRWLSRRLLADRERLRVALKDPLLLNLLVLFTFTHLPSATQTQDYPPDATLDFDPDKPPTGAEVMAAIESAVRQANTKTFRNPDQVAAAAYRHGWFDLAEAFSRQTETPTAHWVRAKLAIRAGDLSSAAQSLSRAAKGFSADEIWADPLEFSEHRYVSQRISAEHGTLALSRGELTSGFELFLRAGAYYWLDIAYLAERVLTVDELKGVVERLDSIPIAGPEVSMESEDGYDTTSASEIRQRLRLVLARRLLRDGQLDEGLHAFSSFPPDQAKAARYVAAMKDAERSQGIEQAKALFDAALAAYGEGMETLGFEVAPDFAIYGGNYVGPSPALVASQFGAKKPAEPADDEADEVRYNMLSAIWDWEFAQPQEKWWSQAERDRLQRFFDAKTMRYSYRARASDLAVQAASLVPRDSKTFGLLMCRAAQFVAATEPGLAHKVYRRYLQQSQGSEWKGVFGWNCPGVVWGDR